MDSTSHFIRSTMAIDECVNFVDSFSCRSKRDRSPKMNLTILLEFYVRRKPSLLASTIFDHIIFEMFRCQSWSSVQLTNYLCLVQHDVSMHPLWVGWFKSWPRLIWSNTKNWMVCMRKSKVDSWWRNEVSTSID